MCAAAQSFVRGAAKLWGPGSLAPTMMVATMPTEKHMEAEPGQRILNALKSIEALMSVVSYALVAVLGLLYNFGVLEELWVVALPALQLLALKAAIGGYYGAKVAPRIIEEQYRETAEE